MKSPALEAPEQASVQADTCLLWVTTFLFVKHARGTSVCKPSLLKEPKTGKANILGLPASSRRKDAGDSSEPRRGHPSLSLGNGGICSCTHQDGKGHLQPPGREAKDCVSDSSPGRVVTARGSLPCSTWGGESHSGRQQRQQLQGIARLPKAGSACSGGARNTCSTRPSHYPTPAPISRRRVSCTYWGAQG